jgi:ribose transport system substrate-binding protein
MRNRVRNRLTSLLILSLLPLLVSCRGGNHKRFVIAFSQANSAEPYRAMQKAMMARLLASQPDVELVVADAQQDNNRQIAQVETFTRERPSVLIVAPNERAALTEVMGEAMEEKIPVICLERDIVLPNYTSYVRSDNLEIGHMVGRFIVDQLTKKYGRPAGNVVALRGLLGVEGEINRNKGAHEILDHYPEIHTLVEPVANWIQAEAKDRMAEMLRVLPKIDVVYGHNDPMAVGAYLAAKEAGREKEMIFIGVDGLGGPAGGIRKVMDGVLQATFVYPLCVDKAVEIAMQIIRDPAFKPEKEYTLPSTMVTPENAAAMYRQFTLPDAK